MKRNKIISTALLVVFITALLLEGCKKENQYPSKVVTFSIPVVTIIGDPIIVLNHGDAFTDPGASWKDTVTGENGTVKSTTVVSTTADGLFVITYTATNKYGLRGSATRSVAVTGIGSAFDISGVYLRGGSGPPDDTANVTKLGRGLFQTDNCGGNVYHEPAVFLIQTDSTILMPDQTLPSNGPASFQQANIIYSPQVTLSWAVIASGYGSYVRTFVKQ